MTDDDWFLSFRCASHLWLLDLLNRSIAWQFGEPRLGSPIVIVGSYCICYLLHVNCNHIYGRCFSPIVSGTLIGIVERLVTIEACDGWLGIGLALLELRQC